MTDFSKYSDAELCGLFSEEKRIAERAFAEIYSRYSQKVYAYCFKVTGYQNEANDIFQEAFMKFFSSIKEHGAKENVLGYLMTITRNICINYKRDAKHFLNIDDFNVGTRDTEVEDKELMEVISSSLDCLDFESREVFILRVYLGFEHQRIADITGLTLPAVRTRLWRAKEKIKDIVEHYLADY